MQICASSADRIKYIKNHLRAIFAHDSTLYNWIQISSGWYPLTYFTSLWLMSGYHSSHWSSLLQRLSCLIVWSQPLSFHTFLQGDISCCCVTAIALWRGQHTAGFWQVTPQTAICLCWQTLIPRSARKKRFLSWNLLFQRKWPGVWSEKNER